MVYSGSCNANMISQDVRRKKIVRKNLGRRRLVALGIMS